MGWLIVPVHRVAHITPTLTSGTASTGYPFANISTLDPNIRASFSASPDVLKWDRGAASLGAINCLAVINHNLDNGGGDSLLLESSTDDGAVDPYATVTNTAPSWPSTDQLFTFTANQERYLRLTLTFTPNPVIGCLTMGYYYDIGNPVLPHDWTGSAGAQNGNAQTQTGWDIYGQPSQAGRVVSFSFRNVAAADAKAIVTMWSRKMTYNYTAALQDGVGGSSGQTPIILKDSDSNVAPFFGYAQIRYSQYTQTVAQLDVTMQEFTRPTPRVPGEA